MKRIVPGLIVVFFTFTLSITITLLYPFYSLPNVAEPGILVDYSLPPNDIYFDSSSQTAKDWQIIDEGKWGFKLNVPSNLKEKDFEGKSLWVHESDNLRVIVDFGKHPLQNELSLKKNYSQTILSVNNLKALVCTYEDEPKSNKKHFNKVVSLIFLEGLERLGGNEPVFHVEYTKDSDLKTALQVLQTVSFYNPLQ